MQTQVSQIRVTLPTQLQSQLLRKAKSLGLSVSAYVKYLIIDDVKETVYPVKKMSVETKAALEEAMKEKKEGKLIEVKDMKSFLDSL